MLINNISSSVNHYFPLGQIKGFDQISPDVMECIGEYVGCLAPQDQPSWSVYRNTHYFHALFKPRIHVERRRRIEQWENELDTGFSLFQDYKKTIDFSQVFYFLDQTVVEYCKQTGNTNMLTLREYWLDYLSYVTYTSIRHTIVGNNKNDLAIYHILNACEKFDPENNGGPKSLVPMRHLREMAQSMQKTADADIASFYFSDLSSHEGQILTMRNIQSHSCFKKLSSCCLGVCLIASCILDTAHPANSKLFMVSTLGAILGIFAVDNWNSSKEIKVLSPLTLAQSTIFCAFVPYVFLSVTFAISHHGPTIGQRGIRNALLHQRESLKETAKCIKFIWHTRELLTDVFIKGMAAHMSIAVNRTMQSMGRAIRRLQ